MSEQMTVAVCVCGHPETEHFNGSFRGKCFNSACIIGYRHTCKRFRDRTIWKYHCGYHDRWERSPCAKD